MSQRIEDEQNLSQLYRSACVVWAQCGCPVWKEDSCAAITSPSNCLADHAVCLPGYRHYIQFLPVGIAYLSANIEVDSSWTYWYPQAQCSRSHDALRPTEPEEGAPT